MKRVDIKNIRDIRRKAGLNQQSFWSRFGVTQSGGSRYESGRAMPTPAAMLIWLHETGTVNDKMLEAAKKSVKKHH